MTTVVQSYTSRQIRSGTTHFGLETFWPNYYRKSFDQITLVLAKTWFWAKPLHRKICPNKTFGQNNVYLAKTILFWAKLCFFDQNWRFWPKKWISSISAKGYSKIWPKNEVLTKTFFFGQNFQYKSFSQNNIWPKKQTFDQNSDDLAKCFRFGQIFFWAKLYTQSFGQNVFLGKTPLFWPNMHVFGQKRKVLAKKVNIVHQRQAYMTAPCQLASFQE